MWGPSWLQPGNPRGAPPLQKHVGKTPYQNKRLGNTGFLGEQASGRSRCLLTGCSLEDSGDGGQVRTLQRPAQQGARRPARAHGVGMPALDSRTRGSQPRGERMASDARDPLAFVLHRSSSAGHPEPCGWQAPSFGGGSADRVLDTETPTQERPT